MNEVSKGDKCKSYRDSKRIVFPQTKDRSTPSNEQDQKHIRIMSKFKPSSEMPGNDR